MKYYILIDENNKKAKLYKNQLKKKLIKHSFDSQNFEYLFIIGGDGAFLHSASKYLFKDIKIIFINAGTLGFYSSYSNIKDINLKNIENDKNYNNLNLLEVLYKNQSFYCINDFSYNSWYAIKLDIHINNCLLETIKGNGILITTPIGSTARNKSLNGPIIMPNIPVIAITEIEPVHNRFYSSLSSSIILSNNDVITIKPKIFNDNVIIVDGIIHKLKDLSEVKIKHTTSKAKLFINTKEKEWIKKLNYSFRNENEI